jgi:hypothetical protein
VSTPTISDIVASALACGVPRPIVATWLDGIAEGLVRIDEAAEDRDAESARAFAEALLGNIDHIRRTFGFTRGMP